MSKLISKHLDIISTLFIIIIRLDTISCHGV
uniref:Uncharacterized protein n=1 Tax=Inoviridae sp. ctDEu7 TaxID=2826759 RepID=A0A8S5MUQ2_9VIRU|nr:MAG TPA: hypothetical protein [Inoviridae sp. ctDEu7]